MKIKPLTYWTVVAVVLLLVAILKPSPFLFSNVLLAHIVCVHLYFMELSIEASREWTVEKKLL
jgi:hypothetical protein